ncbi:MAG: hypothetical protein L6R41_007116, partial [Letrouitia leprolyta]
MMQKQCLLPSQAGMENSMRGGMIRRKDGSRFWLIFGGRIWIYRLEGKVTKFPFHTSLTNLKRMSVIYGSPG